RRPGGPRALPAVRPGRRRGGERQARSRRMGRRAGGARVDPALRLGRGQAGRRRGPGAPPPPGAGRRRARRAGRGPRGPGAPRRRAPPRAAHARDRAAPPRAARRRGPAPVQRHEPQRVRAARRAPRARRRRGTGGGGAARLLDRPRGGGPATRRRAAARTRAARRHEGRRTMSGISRRDLLLTGAALGGAALARGNARAQEHDHEHEHEHHHPAPPPKATPGARTAPRATPTGWRQNGSVTTPNGVRAPWNVVDGVKVFPVVAEPVRHELVDGLTVECWGYNGRTPGPTIEVTEGDRCRFYVQNRLPEATSIHWHGVFLPNGMDGVVGLTQKAIGPGETYVYEFTFTRPGTFMYHPHADEMTQIAFGMMGMIVVHPRNRPARRVRDYAILLHEWKVVPGARRPDPLAMNDFNVLTMNSKAYPATEPLVAELGDLVRIRLGNLSPMDHHPIHIHGHAFRVVETDGGAVPAGARAPGAAAVLPAGAGRVDGSAAGRARAPRCRLQTAL